MKGRIDPGADPEKLQDFFSAANAEHAEAAAEIRHREYRKALLQILRERGYNPDTGEWDNSKAGPAE